MHFINEFELRLDAQGEASIRIALPPPADGNFGHALVLIERLEAQDGAPFEAINEGINSPDLADVLSDVAVFAGPINEGVETLRIGLFGRAGERFRVFVGWARRHYDEATADLSCTVCRKSLKAAFRAALAAIGIPTPGEVISAAADQLIAALATEGIAAFLYELFGERLVGRLQRAVDAVLGMTRVIDEVCRKLCREIGLCD
ncbi:hypothetical protein [Sphingomonas sp. C3-2]|uniref:hypothetical protein n=1 Tax=Sphingomonas sp. C3-2 TaxID=3062169 RepID=UPI00294B2B5C|nr:hypothetical protein [Sphingomonas sp. C3-2]WOK38017.1 hypothetical protein QYC26_07505 [Sphingomonas sp. C3-2]